LRNGTENRTHSFSELKRCLCVQGAYPKELIDLWEDYNNSKGKFQGTCHFYPKQMSFLYFTI